jgi:GT2 family glycosyltransferase
MKIAAVVVTYNRLSLLKECIQALRAQTYPLDKIIVVNNSSTDGTLEWLLQQPDIDVVTQENSGSAGGQYTGIKKAYDEAFDWIWCMDDDTIPSSDALLKLIDKIPPIQKHVEFEIGFLCSKVIWIDSTPHQMNIPAMRSSIGSLPFNFLNVDNVLLCESASFVSIIYNRKAISKLGFPNKDYVIWGDDVEYSNRMTQNRYLGVYVNDSIVLHKTTKNKNAEIILEDEVNYVKFYYGVRNTISNFRKYRKKFYFLMILKTLFYNPYLILFKRKNKRLKLLF